MDSALNQSPAATPANIMASMIEKGVRVGISNDQISFRVPTGAISREELEKLQGSRDQLTDLLRQVDGLSRRSSKVDFAPLAFSQLLHWKLHNLSNQKSARVVTSAVRLQGTLDVGALKACIQAMIDRHEALRTAIGTICSLPVQVIFKSVRSEMSFNDLTLLPRSARESQLEQIFWAHALEPVDIAQDRLFLPKLVRLASEEHVLITAMDHMISDGISMAILLREILEQYESSWSRRRCSLPEIRVQFADYAVWQRRMYTSLGSEGCWSDHLSGATTTISMSDVQASARQSTFCLGYVPICIGPVLKEQLHQWSRARKTTIVMAVFTAFTALVLRWCRATEGVIQYQTSGRSMVEVQNTLGYFAFRLYLRLSMRASDNFIDLMDEIKAEYVVASKYAEFSSMNAYEKSPAIARNPCFNWLVHDPSVGGLSGADREAGVRCSRVPFEDQITHLDGFKTDTDLMVGFREMGDVIRGSVQVPRWIVSMDSAERFARNLMVFVRTLLWQPEVQVMRTKLVE